MTEKFNPGSREFPWEFAEKREVLFYPDRPGDRAGGPLQGDVLEIGPGQGYLLLGQAKINPDKKFVAIEFGKKRYYRLIGRIEKLGIGNIQLVAGLAQTVVPRYLPLGTFERTYVLFPDPWPKARHAQHRLLTADFIAVLACILKPDGDLIIATDYGPYAEWVARNGEKVRALERLGSPYCDQSQIPDYLPTYFGKKWRGQGKDIFFLRYLKKNMPVARNLDLR
jgi:tRNA (guanine-N7-)-methyltransferase